MLYALPRLIVGDGVLGAHEVTLPPKAHRGQGMQVETEGQRPANTKAEGQKYPEFKSGGPRSARSGPELEDKLIRKSYSIFDSF